VVTVELREHNEKIGSSFSTGMRAPGTFFQEKHACRKDTIIGPNDLIIASIAKANDLILITHNGKEFNRVDGLTVEDWQK
jgi:predicted nuclease of predicted toxin-antitoxin system